jgi:carbon-monoxide dehydrogenase small subunit
MKQIEVTLNVNGKDTTLTIPPRMSLVDCLRDMLRLTGTHVGCEHGVCGACSVFFDDEPIRSCLMFAVQAEGHKITTVEGLLNDDGSLSDLQDSFWECHAMQCGYCTPGMLVASEALLAENSNPNEDDIREAISGNLCRCTGYGRILEAVDRAAAMRREARS